MGQLRAGKGFTSCPWTAVIPRDLDPVLSRPEEARPHHMGGVAFLAVCNRAHWIQVEGGGGVSQGTSGNTKAGPGRAPSGLGAPGSLELRENGGSR